MTSEQVDRRALAGAPVSLFELLCQFWPRKWILRPKLHMVWHITWKNCTSWPARARACAHARAYQNSDFGIGFLDPKNVYFEMSHVKMNKLTGARAREHAGQLAQMSFLTPEMDSTSKTTYDLIYHMKKLNKLTGARARTRARVRVHRIWPRKWVLRPPKPL